MSDLAAHAGAVRARIDRTMGEELRARIDAGDLDPADVTLFATGGGGPLHGCAIATVAGIGTVVGFRFGSVFSAYVVSWVAVALLWMWILDGDVGIVSVAVRAVGPRVLQSLPVVVADVLQCRRPARERGAHVVGPAHAEPGDDLGDGGLEVGHYAWNPEGGPSACPPAAYLRSRSYPSAERISIASKNPRCSCTFVSAT